MLKVAKKYKTNLAAIRLSPTIRASLPAWYHPCADPHPITSVNARCLLNNHAARTVADLIKLANKARNRTRNDTHVNNQACICIECVRDRRQGCRNPHSCALKAETCLKDIAPKYNPLAIDPHDTLSLTPDRKARRGNPRNEDHKVLFDPTITCKKNIDECFRVFTDPERISNLPASRRPQHGSYLDHLELRAYTDGACMKNGKRNADCGSRVWIEDEHPLNRALKVPGEKQSNQVGELAAVIAATESLPNYCKLTIVTDSMYVIEGLTKHLQTWEDQGWIGIKNADLFKRVAYLLKKRTAPSYLKWVKGHQGIRGNEESDKLAKQGATKATPNKLNLNIPKEFDLQGAKLATLTQAIAYKGIRERQKATPRAITDRNIDEARDAILAYTGSDETTETIWQSIRKRTIRLRAQQFLFKAMHNTPMIGEVWFNIQDLQHRGICGPCKATENMSHILLTCEAGPATTIWDLARNMWPHDDTQWPEITLGTILGCRCLKTPSTPQGSRNKQIPDLSLEQRGASRLLQITISEAAHLIWVLRCERVIQEKLHSNEEVVTRWLKAINRRLTDDKITATIIKKDEQPVTRLVEATWEEVLKKCSDPPDGWINDREVLVGIRA